MKLFDWLLVVVVLTLLIGSVVFLVSSPTMWGWCLDKLDVRNWPSWAWTAVAGALIGILVLMRLWPEKRH